MITTITTHTRRVTHVELAAIAAEHGVAPIVSGSSLYVVVANRESGVVEVWAAGGAS